MEENYKGLLQEYCQKHHLSLPKYRAYDEAKGFIATVQLPSGRLFKGKVKRTKGAAQQSAARRAFIYIESNREIVSPSKKVVVLMDLENVRLGTVFEDYIFENVEFHGFFINAQRDLPPAIKLHRVEKNVYIEMLKFSNTATIADTDLSKTISSIKFI